MDCLNTSEVNYIIYDKHHDKNLTKPNFLLIFIQIHVPNRLFTIKRPVATSVFSEHEYGKLTHGEIKLLQPQRCEPRRKKWFQIYEAEVRMVGRLITGVLMLICVALVIGASAPVAAQDAPAGTLIQSWPLASGWSLYYAPEEGITNIGNKAALFVAHPETGATALVNINTSNLALDTLNVFCVTYSEARPNSLCHLFISRQLTSPDQGLGDQLQDLMNRLGEEGVDVVVTTDVRCSILLPGGSDINSAAPEFTCD